MGIFDKLKVQKGYRCNSKYYKYDTLENINDIPVPTKKFEMNCDMLESVEYVLQRKATEHKQAGNIELAIACLKKSNEIMPYSPIMYGKDEYLRLPKYLRKAGRFDEAKAEEIKILGEAIKQKNKITETIIENAKTVACEFDDFPLIEVPRETTRICGECAKYHDRIYSVDGKDKRFPSFDIFEEYMKSKSCSCSLVTFPFSWGISIMQGEGEKDPIQYSNRPFLDNRSQQEKENYENYSAAIKAEEKDRRDYDWICEHLPEIAPKSFGGYRKMKNSNSTNYQKIVNAAKEKGYTI